MKKPLKSKSLAASKAGKSSASAARKSGKPVALKSSKSVKGTAPAKADKAAKPAKAAKAPASAEKLDLLKVHKAAYVTPSKPVLLTPKAAQYLVVEGQGAPGGPVFEARLGALYSMAFTIKMSRKFAGKGDYAVSKLEAVYPGIGDGPGTPREQWCWKLMILSPDFLASSDLEAAVALLTKRGKQGDAALVRLERIQEGPCVQMLHVGPYDRECETLAVMEAFAKSKGLGLSGFFHEIYFSDPRRVEADKLRTLIRHPVSPL